MAGTYSKIYLHVILAVKGRKNLLHKKWRDELFKYIAGIITGKDQIALIVNGVGDHVHCLIGIKPAILISDLVRDIKKQLFKIHK
jgi:putative transposase